MRASRYTAKTSVFIFTLFILSANIISGQTRRLIVIDPLVKNEVRNISGTIPEQKVVVLPDEGNPLKYIANELKESEYNEVHLYLLTKPGSIIFDEINIIPENIQDYSADFNEWKSITRPEFKIIIYSENLASEPGGLFLIKKITEFTGREVTVK